jgi:hypothetical protein
MNRKIFTLVALVALFAAFVAPANAAAIFFYRQVYAPVPVYQPAPVYQPVFVYQPAPIVAFDPAARYTGAYDIQGVITSAVPYHLTVRIRDQYFPVLEHNGTIINPTGVTLTPSMIVNVAGFWDRYGVFHADRIDVLRF